MGKIIDLDEYRKQKEAEEEAKEEDESLQCFINHAKSLDW